MSENQHLIQAELDKKELIFMAGGGEMGARMRSLDWSATSLGPPNEWPQSLRTTVNIILSSKIPMSLWWGNELIQFYNDAYQSVFGNNGKYPEALGQRGEEFGLETWSSIKPLIDQVRSSGEATGSENQLLPIYRNGNIEEVYWTLDFSPVYDESGNVGGVLVVSTEATNKSNNFKNIDKSWHSVLDIFSQAPVAVAIFTGSDFMIEYANQKVLEYWGRTLDQAINKPLFEALPEAAGQGFEEILTNVLTTGERFVAKELSVYLERNQKLEKTYINFVYEPYRDSDGSISGVIVVANEVTELVVARKEVEESKEKYSNLFEIMDQGFCLLEMIFDSNDKPLDYRFLEANPVFEQQTGLKDAIGKTARQLVPDLEEHWFEYYGKVALTGESAHFIERSEAMGRWFEVSAFRFGDSDSRKVALLFTDITSRKLAEQSLQMKNEQLERINADLDNFIYTASHDLRAPIINIEGLMNVVHKSFSDDRKKDEKIKALMSMIYQSIDSFKSTIKDLTEVAKVKSNGDEDLAEISFTEIFEDVKLNTKSLIDESKALIHHDFSSAPVIHFSKKNLRSILYNLVSNAIKYRSPDRPAIIHVTSSKPDKRHILLSVQDNGLGIKEQDKLKVFKMFTRLHVHVDGTGVGMSIVKKIVDNNGGRIEIESTVDQGSLFKIYLKD